MTPKAAKHKESGFTLLELLVALSLFATAMVTLFTSTDLFLSTTHKASAGIIQNRQTDRMLQTIADDLDMVFVVQPPRYQVPGFNAPADPFGFFSDTDTIEGRSFSRLSFASKNHIDIGGRQSSGIARITYYVHSHQDGFHLHRADYLAPYPEEPSPCRDPIVYKNIRKFELTFIDSQGDDFDAWDSDASTFGHRLPNQIRIQLQDHVDTRLGLAVNREIDSG